MWQTVNRSVTRSHLWVAVLSAAVFAGLAAGLVVARGSSAPAIPVGLIAKGEFRPVGWTTRGTVSIVGRRDGKTVLRLRNFQTQPAPELWIMFEYAQGFTSRKSMVGLRQTWGNQDYVMPASVAAHPPTRVYIFCAKCGKAFGYAQMHRAVKAGAAQI
jgi:Electron transfer DM13